MRLLGTHTYFYDIFISVRVLCVGGQVILTGTLFVRVLCLCVYAQPHRASLSDGSCLFVADRCSLLTRPKSDERRGCSLKFRYLPLDSSVDPLCCRSLCTMSHQLTGLIGRDRHREKIFSSARLYSSDSFYLASGSPCTTSE